MNEEQPSILEDSQEFQQYFNKEKAKPSISYLGQLGILIGLVGVGLIVTLIIQTIFTVMMCKCGLQELSSMTPSKLIALMAKPENFYTVGLMQVLSTIVIMIIPVWVYAKIVYNKKIFHNIGFNSNGNLKILLTVIVISIVGFFLSNSLAYLSEIIPWPKNWITYFKKLEESSKEEMAIMLNFKTLKDYIFSLIVVAVCPAIFEETLFRGGLQNILVKWTKMLG